MSQEQHSYLEGTSEASVELMEQVERLAGADATVLLLGEPGSGKNALARELHRRSARAAEPLVEVSLAALSPTLVESELFGHVAGAFTGADRERSGRFQAAGAGTLVLDGIEVLDELVQVKLLRALQERLVEPLGVAEAVEVEARVLATATPSLRARVEAGEYRKDLWYRLAVVVLEVPPLRARLEDIAGLAAHLGARAAARLGVPSRELSAGALERLEAHTWPGNVRELENALERAHALAGPNAGALQAEELDFLSDEQAGGAQDLARAALARGLSLEDWTQEMIQAALEEQRGNKSAAARRLGITRRALDYRLARGEEG
ncbi:MAG: sigma 54-interacting transcriptional regulator [Planctomycetes bacterium]|nr:sigma 54-interacting transcriptional regulator [Planctomycetota bacterium]